jgi:dihydroorotase
VSFQVSIIGIMTAITTTTIVITTKANPTGTTTASTARGSTCIREQMPVSELAVMVQAAVNFKAHGEREKSAWRGSWQ